jgi:hypothetical protein
VQRLIPAYEVAPHGREVAGVPARAAAGVNVMRLGFGTTMGSGLVRAQVPHA